jgi:hypothetical protein
VRSSSIPFAMLGFGIIIGAGLMLAATPTPVWNVKCQTYGVSHKVATSYVLRSPPAEVVYKACPQVTEKAEPVSEPEIAKVDEIKPRHHRRHHRVRRYWR